ncbi:MAG: FAD-binding oxidoreductase [Alphaproteobacteria bacterium]|nr:FAD-binding oxidoreductase [Alphaproteobacteria bacterium]
MQSVPRTGSFLDEVRTRLGPDAVALDEARLRAAGRNVEGFDVRVPALIRARSTAEVQAVIQAANAWRQPLHPFSRGRNWGYGTRLGPDPDAVLLDLSGLTGLRLDLDNGAAWIEPGVTQAQLAAALEGTPFYADVTGSSADTSVLGNTLERGVAYNSLRADALRQLEVVLGDGTLLRTGFGHYPHSALGALYRHGVGPDLTPLFLQSNYGVVTGATVALRPRPERQLTFRAGLRDPAQLPAFIRALSDLKRALGMDSIVHVGDRARALSTVGPVARARAEALGTSLTRAETEALVGRIVTSPWTALGVLEGTRGQVAAGRRALQRALRPFGPVRFDAWRGMDRVARVAGWLGWTRVHALAWAVRELAGLTRGVPTRETLRSVHWPLQEDSPTWACPEQGPAGWLLFTPLMPARDGTVREALAELARITAAHDTPASVTLNLLTDAVLEAVVSLTFPLDDAAARDRAHAACDALHRTFVARGWMPYRTTRAHHDTLHTPGDPFWEVTARLKDVLDPNGILSPGRYVPARGPRVR